MKICFIIVLYKTPKKEELRLKREIKSLGFKDFKIFFEDNTNNNLGYASGVNAGIKKGLEEKTDLFVIANPDISIRTLKSSYFIETAKHFDVFGFAMEQDGKIYYGGEIDKKRLSGGLVKEKPGKRFIDCDFVSGSLIAIKKEVIKKAGFLNENFFMYYEDVEYCRRAKLFGFKIGIDSKNKYEHFELSKNNKQKNYYLFRNRLLFMMSYGNLYQKAYELIRFPKTLIEFIRL